VGLCQRDAAEATVLRRKASRSGLSRAGFHRIASAMKEGAEFEIEGEGNARRLRLSGPYLVSTIGAIDQDLRAIEGPLAAIDLSEVSEIDTVGAWMATSVARNTGGEITGASPRAARLVEAVSQTRNEADIRPPDLPPAERVPHAVGQMVLGVGEAIRRSIAFLGQFILAAGSLIRHPSRFRVKALVRQSELVGISALPIIGLMSFLIGIVIAQQGAAQLRQFGAEIYTINLTGRLSMRELGVLMTAIMVAGRSGSAFAAQLGTMKLTEEIDAMRTIGVSPMEALVIPRIMAAVLMMPLLGFFSAAIAIIGGAFIADLTLGIPFMTFLSRIQEVVPIYDVWVGLIKAPVFGLIVGLAGCYQGMQVEGDSEQVGLRTTKAVVQAIFMVIVLDAFFAVFFDKIGWG
jgi:phospholipid/cholesterol/gamma-HCH transport system permease protein